MELPIAVSILKEAEKRDTLFLHLAKELLSILGNNFVGLYSVDTWEGCNVRIIVREKNEETYRKIFETIERLELEFGCPATIIPDIATIDEARASRVDPKVTISNNLMEKLRNELKRIMSNNFVGLYSVDTWEGCNVRIIVREKNEETYRKIFETIERLELEFGCPATIIPDIVEENEL